MMAPFIERYRYLLTYSAIMATVTLIVLLLEQ